MKYHLHRPRELRNPLVPETVASVLAGTAGPITLNDKPMIFTQAQVDRLYEVGESFGARPCRRDIGTGYVHLGHYVFVPEVNDVHG